MTENFEEILDKCIDSINSGQSIDECLSRYPEHAAELMPLLKTVASTHQAIPFTPTAEKKQKVKEQLLAAMGTHDGKRRRPFFAGLFRKTKVWASAAAAAAVALIAVYGIGPLLANNPAPEPIQGDFALMISDDDTIIDLFESVEITINKVSLYHETEEWQDIIPDVTTVDLTDIKGILAQKIWEGPMLAGQYTKASIDIASVYAVLNISGTPMEISISGVELVLELPFEITEEDVTNFVYDLTVEQEGLADYDLAPVAGDSGVMEEGEYELISAP